MTRPQQTESNSTLKWPNWLPWLVTACAILAFYRLGNEVLVELGRVLHPVLVPLLLSIAMAFILEPFVMWQQRRIGLSRPVSIISAILIGSGALGMILLFIVPPVVAQLIESAQELPKAAAIAIDRVQPLLEEFRVRYPTMVDRIMGQLRILLEVTPGQPSFLTQALHNAGGQIVGLTANILNVILVPAFTFYILSDLESWRKSIERFIPPRFRGTAAKMLDRTGLVVTSFVRGQLTVALILSCLYTPGFWMVGVPLPLSLGFLAGFGYLIPYVGTLAAVVLSLLMVLLVNPTWGAIIGLIVVYVIVQSIEGFYLTPRILGHRLHLHPMVVIVGIILAGSLFGILGVVLALPVLALMKVWLGVLLEPYLASSDPYRQMDRTRPQEGVTDLSQSQITTSETESLRGESRPDRG